MAPSRRPLAALCLTVFTDLLGFGVILPVLPYAAGEFGASGAGIGVLFAAYSVAQLLAAPLLGAASDRYGRKPLLLLALCGSVLSLAWTALAGSFAALVAARALAGACGGSIGVAHAFAADLAPPGERTRTLGMVSASVGLGFVAGPALGAALAAAGAGIAGASAAAACVAAVALALAAVTLPSPRPAARSATGDPGPGRARSVRARSGRARTAEPRTSGYRRLLAAGFAATAAFTTMEGTIALLGSDRHGLTPAGLGWLLAAAAAALALVQAVLVGPLDRTLGTRALAVTGTAAMTAGLVLLPLLSLAGATAALLLLAAGYGLLTPALATLVTRCAPGRTGAAMGAAQSAAALARAVAPAAAGVAYDGSPAWPYLGAAALCAVAALTLPAPKSGRPLARCPDAHEPR